MQNRPNRCVFAMTDFSATTSLTHSASCKTSYSCLRCDLPQKCSTWNILGENGLVECSTWNTRWKFSWDNKGSKPRIVFHVEHYSYSCGGILLGAAAQNYALLEFAIPLLLHSALHLQRPQIKCGPVPGDAAHLLLLWFLPLSPRSLSYSGTWHSETIAFVPIARTRLAERGIGMGSGQTSSGAKLWACVSWAKPIRRARRPPGATRRAAIGRTVSKCSTARRVTTSAGRLESASARPGKTLMFVNVKLRVTSRRKVAFFWLDSIRVTSMSGAQIFIGRPGKPAPEPMSIRRVLAELCSAWTAEGGCPHVVLAGKSWRAANRDSPKWRVTISSGWRTAVRLMRAFQRTSRLMYVDMLRRSLVVSLWSLAGPRKGWRSSAMRVVFIRIEIVDGGEEILNLSGRGKAIGNGLRKRRYGRG
jgi:hypothetical protein